MALMHRHRKQVSPPTRSRRTLPLLHPASSLRGHPPLHELCRPFVEDKRHTDVEWNRGFRNGRLDRPTVSLGRSLTHPSIGDETLRDAARYYLTTQRLLWRYAINSCREARSNNLNANCMSSEKTRDADTLDAGKTPDLLYDSHASNRIAAPQQQEKQIHTARVAACGDTGVSRTAEYDISLRANCPVGCLGNTQHPLMRPDNIKLPFSVHTCRFV